MCKTLKGLQDNVKNKTSKKTENLKSNHLKTVGYKFESLIKK